MQFTQQIPINWKDLQDKVAQYLCEAGYSASSPRVIETARGCVEVDVYVESPDVLVKTIICECKYWNSAVTKEKVHAFRTVVNDSGASLGLIIAKTGFQSGAAEAARFSNVQLLTWQDFVERISEKWMNYQLKELQRISHPLVVFTDPLDIPIEDVSQHGKELYLQKCRDAIPVITACFNLIMSGWTEENRGYEGLYGIESFSSWDEYIRFLKARASDYSKWFADFFRAEKIVIPQYKLELFKDSLN